MKQRKVGIRKISAADFKHLRALLREGFSKKEIARQLHVTEKHIQYICRKFKDTDFPY